MATIAGPVGAPEGVVTVTITPPGGPTETVRLSTAALGPLARLVAASAVPPVVELGISEAAARVRVPVSRLEAAVAAGELPARYRASGLVIEESALAVYDAAERARRRAALDELTALSQQMGLYDL